jgi:hypothetical protein
MSKNDWYDDPSIVNEPWCLNCGAGGPSSCRCIEVDGEIIVPEDDEE